jgi:hypothetical protein
VNRALVAQQQETRLARGLSFSCTIERVGLLANIAITIAILVNALAGVWSFRNGS